MKNLKVNSEIFEKNKKVIVARTSAFALAVTMFLSGCGKNKEEVVTSPEPTTTVSDEATETPVEITEEPVKVYTTEEKIAYVKANAETFMNEVNALEGVNLDSNSALLQLAYVNGLTPEQVGVSTNDYVLDFITDYENIWNTLTVRTMNNLVNGIALEENASVYGNIYGEHILDNEDRVAYEYFANKTLNIVNLAYSGRTGDATLEAMAKNKLNVETLILDGEFENMDISNVSEEIQYIIRYIAFLDTHFLPEKTTVVVDTIVGEQEYTNYDDSVMGKNYSTDDESFTVTGNIQNDISYLMQRDSVNVTMKYWLGPSLCSYNTNGYTRTRTANM